MTGVVVDADDGVAGPIAAQLGYPIATASDPDDPALHARLRDLAPEVFVLAGYGRILGRAALAIPARMTINLHGGRLPEFRGSSPMNWALMKGAREFTLSVIEADEGIDTGDVLLEQTFPIGPDDTIADLHRVADEAFPAMTVEVLDRLDTGTLQPRHQNEDAAAYYPRRFPADGLVVWDQLTAEQVHNRVRALTEPYPCAYTFFEERRIRLITTQLPHVRYHGEPGRVYRVGAGGLLVGAADRCVWVRRAVFEDNEQAAAASIPRYAELATVRRAVQRCHEQGSHECASEITTLTATS